MKWAQLPFLKLTPVFILGILTENLIHYAIPSCYILMLLVLFTLLFCSILARIAGSFFLKKLYVALVLTCFFWLGFLTTEVSQTVQKPTFSDKLLATATNYTIRIHSKADSSGNFIKYQAILEEIKFQGKWEYLSNNMIVYFRQGRNSLFNYGDKILVEGHPTFIENQKNPAAFDYGLFLQRKGIYLLDYIETDDFMVINSERFTSPAYWGMFAGDYLENTLAGFIASPRELNIIKAMLLGRRNEVSSEMEYVYQSTGTTHILAVSGLHVGIVFFIVSTLFSFLKGRKPKWAFYAIVLFAIWSFALITGFSPSVQRAATMFSFILFGEYSKRKSNIYNTILASAFFILLLSPNLIYSVAFQLSYVAVLGIVFFYYKVYPMLYVKNPVLDFFWKITVLSISVQLATFAITIYYFHQFPTLFAITNLFAIPTAMAVLGGSFTILATSFLGIIPNIIAQVLEWWIFIYNEIMLFISKLPFSLIPDLYLKPYHVFILLLLIVFASQFLNTKKLFFFRYFTIALFVLSGISLYDYYRNIKQEQIIFYHINDQCYYDFFEGKSCFTNIDTHQEGVEEDVYFNVQPYRKRHLIEQVKDIENLPYAKVMGKNTLIYFQNKSILILNDLISLSKQGKIVTIDYLVVGREAIKNLPGVMDILHFRHLILDNSIETKYYEKFLNELPNSAEIHSIQQEGAFIIGI